MLAKPVDGWARVTLGDFVGETSYIDDVPFVWLRACLQALRDDAPLALHVDEEMNHCYLLVTHSETYVIVDRYGEARHFLVVKDAVLPDIAEALARDIRENFEDWVEWNPDEDSEEDFARRRTDLEALLASLEDELENWRVPEDE